MTKNIFLIAISTLLFGTALIYESVVSAASDANNSAVNQRDQNESELTAQDQGNSSTDVALTQNIRQQVVSDKAFSSAAKNIKIISVNGVVTLKGPVKTASEKRQIEKIAKHAAGRSQVVSEIDVE